MRLADDMPNVAVWFPPAGLERRNVGHALDGDLMLVDAEMVVSAL